MQRSRNIQPVTVMHPIEMIARRPVVGDKFVITAAEYVNFWKFLNCKEYKYCLKDSKSESVGKMRKLMYAFQIYFRSYDFTPFLDWASVNWDTIQEGLIAHGKNLKAHSRMNINSLLFNSELCFEWYAKCGVL